MASARLTIDKLTPALMISLTVSAFLIGRPSGAQQRDWTFGPFEKPKGANPVLTPSRAATFTSPMDGCVVRWEEMATFNPAAVVRHDTVFVLYRGEDTSGDMKIGHHTSRIGLAHSTTGLRFTRRPTPILYPDKDNQTSNEWPGGVEDPRIVETDDGRYVLTYTQWNREVPRVAVATSRDLVRWTKHGPAFANVAGESTSRRSPNPVPS